MLASRRQFAVHRRLPRRRTGALAALAAALFASACTPVGGSVNVGYARLAIDGDLALESDSGSSVPQGVDRAFGLGSERDAPYVRATADFGVPELVVSGFWLSESGEGVLDGSFGGLPAGTTVTTSLELGNLKVAGVAAFALGPVTIAPGAMFDAFAIDFRASNSPGNREEVDELVGVPMPFVRVEAHLATFAATLEAGYLDLPGFFDADGRFADLEAALSWRPGAFTLEAGYRLVAADAEGNSGSDTVDIDLRASGWFVGGGLRF